MFSPGTYAGAGFVASGYEVTFRAVSGTPADYEDSYNGAVVINSPCHITIAFNSSFKLQGVTFAGFQNRVIDSEGDYLELSDCVFHDNTSSDQIICHGAVYGGMLCLNNCLFYQNSAPTPDKYIVETSTLTMNGCTFDYNGNGYEPVVSSAGNATIRNSVFSRRYGTGSSIYIDCGGILNADYIATDGGFSRMGAVHSFSTADLGFTSLANHDYRPRFKSVLEDAGDPASLAILI